VWDEGIDHRTYVAKPFNLFDTYRTHMTDVGLSEHTFDADYGDHQTIAWRVVACLNGVYDKATQQKSPCSEEESKNRMEKRIRKT